MQRIIAIDPGPVQSAIVVWNGQTIEDALIRENEWIVGALGRWQDLPVPIACEMIASYGMAVGATVFETCVWVGRFWQAAPYKFDRLFRREVKLHLCGSARAKDANIRQALIDRFGPPGTKKAPGLTYGLKGDMWAAFAVAVTWWDLNATAQTSPLKTK